MPGGITFREQVVEKLRAALGEPEVTYVASGPLYRWTLDRGQYGVPVFVTVDSPEFTDIAHIMISDAASQQVEPVAAVTVRTHAEADVLIERILRQWKGNNAGT